MKRCFHLVLVVMMGLITLCACNATEPSLSETKSVDSGSSTSKTSQEKVTGMYQELLKNSNFEDKLNGWDASDWIVINTGGRHGVNSFEAQAGAAPGEKTILSQIITIPETGYYTAKAPIQGDQYISGTLDIYGGDGKLKKSSPIRNGQWYYENLNSGVYCEKGEKVKFQIELTATNSTMANIAACSFMRVNFMEEDAVAGKNPVSYLAKRTDGTYYPMVAGKPFLYNVIQEGYFSEEVAKKIVEAGFNTVCVWVRWAKMESYENAPYDFKEIDEYLRIAKKYSLKLSINWGGSNFCGGLWSEFPPTYIIDAHDYHQKDTDGICEIGFSNCHVAKVVGDDGKTTSSYVFQRESKALAALLAHLDEADMQRNLIADIQLLNEPTEATNTTSLALPDLANYIDALAKIVKESDYSLITRVNTGFGTNIDSIFNTKYIDMNGLDSYCRDINITKDNMMDRFNSRFPNISETCTFDNTTAHMFSAFAGGGGFNIFSVIQDVWNNKMDSIYYFQVEYKDEKTNEMLPFPQNENSEFMKVWDNTKPTIEQRCLDYTKPYEQRTSTAQGFKSYYVMQEHTKGIMAVNKALNEIGEIIAVSPLSNMVSFNTDSGSATPEINRNQTEKLGNVSVAFTTDTGACGMSVLKDGTVYCIADRACSFTVNGVTKQLAPGNVIKFDT